MEIAKLEIIKDKLTKQYDGLLETLQEQNVNKYYLEQIHKLTSENLMITKQYIDTIGKTMTFINNIKEDLN